MEDELVRHWRMVWQRLNRMKMNRLEWWQRAVNTSRHWKHNLFDDNDDDSIESQIQHQQPEDRCTRPVVFV